MQVSRMFMAAVVLTVSLAMATARAQSIDLSFVESSAGQWDVLVAITGDTSTSAGLSAYSIWVDGVDPASVSYSQNTLSTLTAGGTVGFAPATVLAGNVGGNFNAGNSQTVAGAILNIGESPVSVSSLLPASFPDVELDVPALLGTLSTPVGLGEANFRAGTFALFNANGDGFLSTSPEVNVTVTPIPEPATLTLIGAGALLLARRRMA